MSLALVGMDTTVQKRRQDYSHSDEEAYCVMEEGAVAEERRKRRQVMMRAPCYVLFA